MTMSKRNIMLVPISTDTGLTSVSLGFIHALERSGLKTHFFKPVAQQPHDYERHYQNANSAPFPMDYVQEKIGDNKLDVLLEEILERAQKAPADTEVTIVEGLVTTRSHPFSGRLNRAIASALDCDIIFVGHPANDSPKAFHQRLEIIYQAWGGAQNKSIQGCIMNKLNAPVDSQGYVRPDLTEIFDQSNEATLSETAQAKLIAKFEKNCPMPVLGAIPFQLNMLYPRACDLAKHLDAQILNAGDMAERRLHKVTFCARSLPNLVEHITAGSLLVTSGDRADVIVSANLAAMNGVKIGALLLTSGYEPDPNIMALCEQGFATGLPVFVTSGNTWQTSLNIHSFDQKIPTDDQERIRDTQEFIASHLNESWLQSLTKDAQRQSQLSPPAFRYQLTQLARAAQKTVVLPEGDEPRTVKAAAICAERGIANCVLLGNPQEIQRVAAQEGVQLGQGITILDPQLEIEKYIEPMVALRKHKGLTEIVAKEQLQDTVVLGTMMLQCNQVDGLVSGAVHTTANTIRPALQLIKTAPNSKLVSSVFFMLMPEQVYIYGDCAINPDPTAAQLADIAIQSADSASAFGIEPKVAMISYSTGASGSGSDVEKVRQATALAQQQRPDLLIDGPLQYDAAVMPNVAKSKAPNSPVAGQANVFIFPDLNTGNTTYKAVQRSADLISIGPMLQGMNKPVNDLSRGALVDDIVYTIALTAIQAEQNA